MTISFDEEKQQKKLEDFREKEEEDLAQIVASRHGLEYADLSLQSINMDALRLLVEKDAREAKAAAVSLVGKKVRLAVVSPAQEKIPNIVDDLERKGYQVTLTVVSTTSLKKAWARYADLSFSMETKAGAFDISSHDLNLFIDQVKTIEDVKKITADIIKLKKGLRISKILEIVISGALSTKASDIHIEPEEDYVRLRYRLDGVLTDILSFDLETYGLLLSRIKLLSGLKLNIKSEAQDGRFSIKISDGDIEIRTSILPGAYSESIVLRILNPKSIQVPLEELGIPTKLLSVILHQITRPNGMVLTTGPTGSGKTTTLYAFMRKIHDPSVKIITIEDPIEYHLPGIVQTQVNAEKNYTFSEGLRSTLRQDPDVIMIGEIRDSETAQIAVNSSLTGHLVFSTLHTNSAAGSFPRLIDLGVNPKIISSAVNITLAQRLVRKLCPICRKKEELSSEESIKIEKILNGVMDKNEIPAEKTSHFKSVGCDKCHNTGYKGRVGIYEGILTTEEINKLIEYSTSEAEINKASATQGILTMSQDGIIKVLKGITSLDELERVIDLTD
jgi:type IV pilus assembly protein PilB